MRKVILNKLEYEGYLRFREIRGKSDVQFERAVDERYKSCQYYNDCSCCALQHDFFTNLACELQLIMLADDDKAEVVCEEEEKIIFY